jgi:glycine reductase
MLTVGSNRIVPGIAIPHPVGDPFADKAVDKAKRRTVLLKAFEAMTTDINEQTIFKTDL